MSLEPFRRLLWTGLVAFLLAGAALSSPVSAAEGEASGSDASFLLHYSCDGLAAFPPADASTVREVGAIPPEFKLLGEDSGTTLLFFWHLLCDVRSDQPHGIVSASGLSVFLESPPPVCPSCPPGVYDIWLISNSRLDHVLWTRTGFFSPLVRRTDVSFDYLNGEPISGNVRVPWSRSPYRVTAKIQPPVVPFFAGLDGCDTPSVSFKGCFPTDHWSKGPPGTFRAANSNCDLSGAAAEMKITARRASPLAIMLGATELEVPGGFVRIREGIGLTDLGSRFETGEVARPECLGQ